MFENRTVIRFLMYSVMLIHLPTYCLDDYNEEGLVIIFDNNNLDDQEQEIFPLYDIDNYQEPEPVNFLEIIEEEQPLQAITITSNDINQSLLVCEQGFDLNQNCTKICENNKKDVKLIKKQKKQKLSRKEKKLKKQKNAAA
ncbi:MAG: hypothetical protein ACXWL5_02725 [Candidatus Chromulinivorax sp.]